MSETDDIVIPAPVTDWLVKYDTQVIETLKEEKSGDGQLYDNLLSTLVDIVEDPFIGEVKTGELRGFRSTHVEHLAIIWENRSEGSGNPIQAREYIDKLGEVYLYCISHHDNMTSALRGYRKPGQSKREWQIRFPTYDIGEELHQLHEDESINVTDVDWRQNGVVIHGTYSITSETNITNSFPPNAEVTIGDVWLQA